MELIHDNPAWLVALDKLQFFGPCSAHHHETARKKEKNICCLDCCAAVCPLCVSPSHRRHRLLQIRRYVYHDVVRLRDLDELIDCAAVQPYTINSSKVVFLKKRPQSRQFKGGFGNSCTSCDRTLQEPYAHCSLECKVDHISRNNGKNLSKFLRINIQSQQEEYSEDSSTIVEGDEQMWPLEESRNFSLQPCVRFIRKRRSDLNLDCRRSARCDDRSAISSNVSRRKGNPRRSPLC